MAADLQFFLRLDEKKSDLSQFYSWVFPGSIKDVMEYF